MREPKARRRPGESPTPATGPAPEALVRELIEQTPGVADPETEALAERMKAPIRGPVKILFVDVDGTLTDGRVIELRDGDARNFWVRDGLALQWARELGVLPVVISGRGSLAVEHRMQDLGLEHYLGVQDKVAVAERVCAREGVGWESCMMVGDDLPDIPLMKRVGWPVAVVDGQPEVKAFARTVTLERAGFGAVREVVEMVLRHNGVWDQILRRYEAM